MKREEAKQMLDTFIDCLYTNLTEERYQELKEAIRVLSEQEQRPKFYISKDVDQEKLAGMIKKFPPIFVAPGTEKIEIIREQQWIPCSERLPKTNGVYIVTRWFGDGCEKRILSDACYFDGSGTWYDDTRLNHGREYVTHKIVAWMPLPSPYKGE